jgi:CysZ protein
MTPNLNFVRGIGLVAEAARLLRRERSLRLPALAPFLISAVALLAATAGIVAYAPDIHAFVSGWLPWPSASIWYEWLWVAPARLGIGALGILLFAIVAAIALATTFLAASLLASPFHDVLSRRVERLVTGEVVDLAGAGVGGFVRDSAGVAIADLQRLTMFLTLQGGIVVVGLLPGAQVVAAPALVLVTIFFLPLEYASYALDRRAFRFRAKLAWARAHRGLTLGFGAAGCLLCAVPIVNLAALPILVTAGTLLVLRSESGTATTQAKA